VIAVVGGTGPQGRALAYRFARAGHDVVIGSRAADRAQAVAAQITERAVATVAGADNATAVSGAELVALTVPYEGHRELVESLAAGLAGKIVVSCVNPLRFDALGAYGIDVPEGSAAEQAAALVRSARLVGAFHHLSAPKVWRTEADLDDEDVLVCGDDAEAKDAVIELASAVTGHPGIDAGRLRLARYLEPLTAVLISVNKRYKVRSGIKITGLPPASERP
jgi:8-hydroxy-5-deazaflavin:NADPH oxidoreductase